MSTITYTDTETLVVRKCWCGIRHALPETLDQEVSDGGKAYCPLGHIYVRRGQTTQQKLKAEQEQRQRDLECHRRETARLRDRIIEEQHRTRAQKAAKTRIKNRVANGVCPCCNRSFQNLHRHMASQHPEFVTTEESK